MLVRHLAVAEAHDRDQRYFHLAAGRRDPRQHPVDLDRVGESEDQLLDQLIAADGARQRGHRQIGRHFRDEMRGVELVQLGLPGAAGQHRDVVNVGVVDHRGDRFVRVVGLELVPHVLFPEPRQGFRRRLSCSCLAHRLLLPRSNNGPRGAF